MNKSSFTFKGHTLDLDKGQVSFHYLLQNGAEEFKFTEKLSFPPVRSEINQEVLKRVLDNLLIVLGVSYWKTYCPKSLELPTINLTAEQAQFWNTVYTKGLGEFFYKNKIDFHGLISFPYQKKIKNSPVHFPRKDRYLLPFGGGKDSIVAAELLLKDKKPFDLFTLNTSQVQAEMASILGKKPIVIMREIDPKLFTLNAKQDTYNGHIPISAIYAFSSLLAAVLYDYRAIIVSNEKSANFSNVEYLGYQINHQWSKSLEFENLFRDYVSKYITSDITYYSILRDMSEFEIMEEFVKYPKYFSAFSSCNRNFKIKNLHLGGVVKRDVKRPSHVRLWRHPRGGQSLRWCGKCAKCAFVFTALAAFLPKQKVIKIFEKNLFEDKSLLPIFKQLLGIEGVKPFECVGTPDEMKNAVSLIKKKKGFVFPL